MQRAHNCGGSGAVTRVLLPLLVPAAPSTPALVSEQIPSATGIGATRSNVGAAANAGVVAAAELSSVASGATASADVFTAGQEGGRSMAGAPISTVAAPVAASDAATEAGVVGGV